MWTSAGTSSPCAACGARPRHAGEGYRNEDAELESQIPGLVKDLFSFTLQTYDTRWYCASVTLQSHVFLRCIAWHLCPAGAQHGDEVLKSPPASDSRSERERPEKDLNITHASAQKMVRPHFSAADNLCLACCSLPNIFSVRSCTWVRVSCGCDCVCAAYQVPSSARNAKTLDVECLFVRHRPVTPRFPPRFQLPAVATPCAGSTERSCASAACARCRP